MPIDASMDAVIIQRLQAAMMNCEPSFTHLRYKRDAMLGVVPARTLVIFRENLP